MFHKLAERPKESAPQERARFLRPRFARDALFPFLALLLAASTAAAGGASPAVARTRAKLEPARLARAPAGWERVRAASEAFLGTPYVRSPLGEGEGPDPDPRFRLDAVDCLTFVETTLALGNAGTVAEARALLDDLRYAPGSERSFATRLHLMEAQWIPAQIRRGYVQDVTWLFGGDATVEAAMQYDEARWAHRPGSLRPVAFDPELRGTHHLPMIPLAEARRLAPTLPEGLIVNVVRSARADRINRVTHTGLVVIRGGERYVRHASFGRKQVVDEPIDRFLGRHAAMRKWTVDGINLLAVRDNARRARALHAAHLE